MAWEWASSLSGAIVGVAGLVTGWRMAVSGRQQDVQLAKQRQDHEVRMAHEQWHRDRRAEAYIELLDLAEEIGLFVGTVYPMFESGSPEPPPSIPSLDRQTHMWARVAAYASPEVRRKATTWRIVVVHALRAAEAIARGEDGARAELHDLRSAEGEARESMSQAINDDLGTQ